MELIPTFQHEGRRYVTFQPNNYQGQIGSRKPYTVKLS